MARRLVAIECREQETMSTAVPKVPFLHCPEDIEPALVVFLVAVVDGGGGSVDAVRAKGVLHKFAHYGALLPHHRKRRH